MYAREVSMHLKANARNEFTRTIEKDILPLLRKQNGFTDEITFLAPEGTDAVAISLWVLGFVLRRIFPPRVAD